MWILPSSTGTSRHTRFWRLVLLRTAVPRCDELASARAGARRIVPTCASLPPIAAAVSVPAKKLRLLLTFWDTLLVRAGFFLSKLSWAMGQLKLVILESIVRSPFVSHREAVIPGASIATLLEAVDLLPPLMKTDGLCLPAAKNCVLHAVMFHTFGGYDVPGLLPPPSTSAAARTAEFAATRTLSREADRFKSLVAGLPPDDAQVFLKQPLTSSNCCLLKSSASSPPPPAAPPAPPPDASTAEGERERRHLCCLMLARGTHSRYGMFSSIRELARSSDLLERIAHFADIHPRVYIPSPPPPERLELHRHLRRQLSDIYFLRKQLDEARVENKNLERERDQATRHAAQALVESRAAQEREVRGRAEIEKRLKESNQREIKLAKQLQAKPFKLEREHKMELQQLLREADVLRIECLREQEQELREYQQRAVDERNDALAENVELQQSVTQLQNQVERVRCTSKAGLLGQVAELQRKLRDANTRRTLNQRRVSDANLADRRSQVAQRQAKAAMQALKEYGLQAEAARELEERCGILEKRAAELDAALQAAVALANKYKEIAEPPRSKFYRNGFEPAVELAAIEAMLAGASCNIVPQLFVIFARVFNVTIPTRNEGGTSVPVGKVDGKMQYTKRLLLCIPGKSHCKELMPILNQLHKLQVGEWLLTAENCCYIADGAESLQRDWCAHLLSQRGADGKLNLMHIDVSQLLSKASEAQAASFQAALDSIALLCKDAGITEEISPLITSFRAVSSMNDRAAQARKAARLVRRADDGDDDPTCAEHALVNILEEGRKAIDSILRELMQITDEQAATDATKVKAMRTAVGWFSSPACSLIYQVSKYVALFSSKGYAVGEKFAQWLAAELDVKEDSLEGELLGYVQDLLAICGSRSYVFFMNAAVVDRFAQEGSLLTYLEQEADMGSEAGGKLRSAILTGYKTEEIRSAVHAMSIICESCVWPALRAIKPSSEVHILDVLPHFWPRALAFFEEAAASPDTVVNGKLVMLIGEADATKAKCTPRSSRAALDIERIRRDANGNALVKRMLTAAFAAMVAGTRNHASEFLSGGKLAAEKITDSERTRLSGCPTTSTAAERVFAIGRMHDVRKGVTRADARSGWMLGKLDNTPDWAHKREPKTLRMELKLCKRRARLERRSGQLHEVRRLSGLEKREEREQKLASVRAKREAKAVERQRVAAVVLKTRYSELRQLSTDDLKDQLRGWKLKLGKAAANFTVTQRDRAAYVLQVQALMATEHGKAANNLPPGDAGTDGRGVLRKRNDKSARKKCSGKRRKSVVEYDGWEWDEDEEFDLDAIVDKQVADGQRTFANLGQVRKGIVVYRLVFKGFPPDMEWWEPRSEVGTEALHEYEAALACEALEMEAEDAEDAELEQMEAELGDDSNDIRCDIVV